LLIKIMSLDKRNCRSFETLVLPLFPGYLDQLDQAELVALGARAAGRPAGLLLARAVPSVKHPGTWETDHWEARQIYVPPAQRRQGVGRELLLALEALLRERGVGRLSLTYTLEESRSQAVDAFIVKCGWPEPVTVSRQYRISRSRLNSRWLGRAGQEVRRCRLPEGVSVTDFTTLTKREKEELAVGRDLWYPAHLGPLDEPGLLNLENSLLLRADGEIAGWLYALKYFGGSVYYRGVFVKTEYRSRAYGFYLLAEAVNRQFERGEANAVFAVNVKNRRMQGLIDNLLGGDYDYVWETKVVKKAIGTKERYG
jgi:GNAT superfamily N-acetyltransferase